MKKFITILFFVFLFVVISKESVFSNNSDFYFGVLGTDKNWNSYVNLFFPLMEKERSILFLEPNISMTAETVFESSSNQSNVGIGYRFLSTGYKSMFGVNLFYDVKNTDINNNFQQLGAGLEYYAGLFCIRVNGYMPFSNTEYFLGKNFDGFVKNYIYKKYCYELAMKGFDAEIGFQIPIPEKLGKFNIYGTYCKFFADKAKDTKSIGIRMEYCPISMLKLSYSNVADKDYNSTGWQVEAALNIPFDFKKFLQAKNPLSLKKQQRNLKDKMKQKVERNYQIQTVKSQVIHYDEILKDDEGNILYFTVVSPAGTGDGTFENPANISDGVMFNKLAVAQRAVLLFLGGNYMVDKKIDVSNYKTNNVLFCGYQEIEYFGADLSSITNTNPVINFEGENSGFNFTDMSSKIFTISSIEFESKDKKQQALNILNSSCRFDIRNNYFKNFNGSIYAENSSSNIYVYNNIFEENLVGILANKNAIFAEQNIFLNNKLALKLLSSNESRIYSNYMHDNECVVYDEFGTDTQIYSNYMHDNKNVIKSSSSINMKIYYNEFEKNSGILNSYSSSSTYVISNKISSTTQTAIFLDSDKFSTIYDNTITHGKETAICLCSSQNSYISSNTVLNNECQSILVFGYANNIDIENNTVLDTKKDAIDIIGQKDKYLTSINIVNNKISNTSANSILCQFTDIVNIYGNEISYTSSTAVLCLESGKVDIYENGVYFTTGSAVSCSQVDTVNIYGNEISYTSSTAVLCLESGKVDIYENGVYFTTGSAVSCSQVDTVNIYGNEISYTSSTAVLCLESGKVDISENGIYFTTGSAVSCSQVDTVNIYGNEIAYTTQDAVSCLSTKITNIDKNKIFFTSSSAISCWSSGVTKISSNILDENKNGIKVSQATSVNLSTNTVCGGANGIIVSDVSNTTVAYNSVSSTTVCAISIKNSSKPGINNNTITSCQNDEATMLLNNVSNAYISMNYFSKNTVAQLKISNSSGLNIRDNIFENSSVAHGLYLYNCSNTIISSNTFFKKNTTSTYFGLYLKGTTGFNKSSGNNKFLNSSYYSGDSAPVKNYETNVKSKDEFKD